LFFGRSDIGISGGKALDRSANSPLLKIEKLEVVYHRVATAVQGVSLEVGRKQIVALLGSNGAGKSTTLRAISGFLGIDDARVTDGSIEFRGKRIQGLPPSAITREGIVLVPENGKVFDNMTVEENLQICTPGREGRQQRDRLIDATLGYFPDLNRKRHRVAGYLSGGERQMLTLSAALLCRPQLLLVDELSLGLAPIVVKELMSVLRTIRDDQGLAILLVEQNAVAALEIADYGLVMENGRIVYSGDREKLKRHENIQEFYLGSGERDSRKSYRDVKQYRRTRRWYG
jgi:branched-chain amino acid transport system ATP-binding protein